jgi:hypothetical protein
VSHRPASCRGRIQLRYGINIAVVTGLNDRIVAINAFRPLMPNRDSVRTVRPGGLAVRGSCDQIVTVDSSTRVVVIEQLTGGLRTLNLTAPTIRRADGAVNVRLV